MEALIEYGLFLAKTLTFAFAIIIVLAAAASVAQRSKAEPKGSIQVRKLNDDLEEYEEILRQEILPKEAFKAYKKQQQEEKKKRKKSKKRDQPDGESKEGELSETRRVFLLEFKGDIKASASKELAEAVTAVLMVAEPERDEVVVKIESPGGVVHGYGLVASQLKRIRDKNIPLTAAVDKVAASGGYLMAVIADRIIAAPFAIVGSIGVVAQIPNFNRLLRKNDVDVELHTAGQYKRTLTMFGENTEEGRQKFLEDLEDTHELFKEFIENHRTNLDVKKLATGEYWFGTRALDLKLVDEIMTSDEYLLQKSQDSEIYSVKYEVKKSVAEKFGFALQSLIKNFRTTQSLGWAQGIAKKSCSNPLDELH